MSAPADERHVRLRAEFRGVVQGVGFRPFIYRLATDLGLTGWVSNTPQGAVAEVEGPARQVQQFLLRCRSEAPPRASVQSLEASYLDTAGYTEFTIRSSDHEGARSALILPDIATCDDCLREMRDPSDRRYRYPFINCTNCGPRYSIILSLPYDRPNTTMRIFRMCEQCLAEYTAPLNRRFHAQPNACPMCGPQIELWDCNGNVIASSDDALLEAAAVIERGGVLALKGLGGFHLVVDAANDEAVQTLRSRKHREEKPLALMCPALQDAREICELSPEEEHALTGPERPIVLARKRAAARNAISDAVAPGNPYWGVMLPYTPLHHLLLDLLGRPVVATSGNLSDEPICTDELEALRRLGSIADLLLVHNRPIARHVDDSIVRVVKGRRQILRRARGFAPLPVTLPMSGPTTVAVGAHLKCAPAVTAGDAVYMGQHVGDLETLPAREAHVRVARDLLALYERRVERVACDLHPDYASTDLAEQIAAEASRDTGSIPVDRVQHHYAHVLSCMAENRLTGSVLGVSWDGTGLGDDGTIWGGEFLLADPRRYRRVAHLLPFRLPGGDAVAREPSRSAAGLCAVCFTPDEALSALTDRTGVTEVAARTWLHMALTGVHAPLTSSMGRLFDGVAALMGLRQVNRFEGQAAMELEWAIREDTPPVPYVVPLLDEGGTIHLDWRSMIRRIVEDVRAGVQTAAIARGFHDALVAGIVEVARRVGERRVVLTGGCFQNRYLSEKAVDALETAGFSVYCHQRVPPNDGGIALGQAYAAIAAAAHCTTME